MEGSASAPAAKKRGVSKKLIAIVLVAIIAVAAVGAAFMLTRGSAKDNYDPTVFRYGTIGGNYDSLDPAYDYETVGGEILQNVYETLVWYNGSSGSDLMPMLATEVPTMANGGISPDGLIYKFTIRDGVKFSDGTLLTAKDVKYSFDRGLILNDPDSAFWMYGSVLVPDYQNASASSYNGDGTIVPSINQTVLDQHIWAHDNEVQFNLTHSYPAFLTTIAFNAASIVSQKYVEDNGGLTKAGYDFMASNAMGTGPYKVGEIKTDSYTKLVANENYWRGAPALKTVIITQYADISAMKMALKSGDLDAAAIPRSQVADVLSMANVTIDNKSMSLNVDFIGLNQNLNVTGADTNVMNVPSNFFADPNVRLAFAHAFNYGQYINTTLQGMAIQPNGALPQGLPLYDASVPKYQYDLTKATEYLKNATNGTANNWLDDGFKIELYYNSGNTARETACQLLKAGLEELSSKISVSVKGLEWSSYMDYRKTHKMPVMFLGWAPDYADADDYISPFFLSSGTYASMVGYSNETLDNQILAAAQELNENARAQMYLNISMDMQKECLYIWTAQATNFFVSYDYVQGYAYNPLYSNLYYFDLNKADKR